MKSKLLLIFLCVAMTVCLTACDEIKNVINSTPAPTGDFTAAPTDAASSSPSETPDGAPTPDPQSEQPIELLALDFENVYDSYKLDTESDTSIFGTRSIQLGALSSDYAAAYPQLNNALINAAKERMDALDLQCLHILKESENEQDDEPAGSRKFDLEELAFVRRADSVATSVLYEKALCVVFNESVPAEYEYAYSCENYDSKTGKRLSLSDVIVDMAALPALINAQFEALDHPMGVDENEPVSEYLENVTGSYWLLEPYGVTFIIEQLGVEDSGIYRDCICLLFSDHPEIFNPDYAKTPESYAVSFPYGMFFHYPLNGSIQEAYVYNEYDENDFITTVGVRFDADTQLEEETQAFGVEPLYVHTADGKDYIYIQITSFNEYHEIIGFDCRTHAKIKLPNAGWFGWYDDVQDKYYTRPVTDPASFKLITRTELLSTRNGSKSYHVGANGMLESDDEMFELSTPIELTLLKELEAKLIDEAGVEKGDTVLPAGTKLSYFRTDDLIYADLLTPSGDIIRIEAIREKDTYELRVNGVNVIDLFDGIIFAD